MAGWYNGVVKNISTLPEAIDHFETELAIARAEDLAMKGQYIEKISANIPAIVEHRYGQLQEIEAILEHLNIEMRKIRSRVFRRYLENYQRALSSRDVEKYVDGDDEVVDMAVLINQFGLLRNQWLGLVKAIDQKSFSVNNIVRLRVAGLDDATL